MNLREMLNEARWRTSDLHVYRVTFIDRGSPNDEKVIDGRLIEAIHWSGFTFSDGASMDEDGETFIPWHRVVRVARAGSVVWEKDKR